MKKTAKLLALLLVLVMAFSLVACKGGDEVTPTDDPTQSPGATDDPTDQPTDVREADLTDIIPEETVTLTVYSQLANFSGEQVGWFAQIMKEKFNVVLNIINEGEGTFATRMESGDLGDIVVFGNDADEYLQAVEAGMLFDWEEDELLDEFGPYIKANMEKALEKNKNISGGNLYGFGHNVGTTSEDHEAFFYRPDIRWDLYKELGYPEVNTLEDFIDVLEEMVKLEPKSETGGKTYGVSMFSDWDGDMVMFVKSTAALYGYDEFGFGLFDTKTRTYEDCLKEGGQYLRALKFYNQLNQRGLLDPDSMTQTYDEFIEKYQTGAAFFTIFDWMGSGAYNSEKHLSEGKAMMPLAAKDQKNIAYGLNVYGENRVWTIGAKTEYPELCMAIINWLATPEGTMVKENGPQGVTWDYDDQGRPYLTDFGKLALADATVEMPEGWSGTFGDGQNQINNETWNRDATNPDAKNGDTYNYNFWETNLDREVSEIEQDWRDWAGALDVNEYLIKNGHISIKVGTSYAATPKSDELLTTWNQVATTIKNYSWQAIYASNDAEFDKIVKEMVEKAKEYGYDECVAYQQAEADRLVALMEEAEK
ncbi:MAG: hypothetical protein QM307_08510 [Bacillota bacterium]|nr:hypothetical protein [Bacillota bacterium]